MSKRRPRRDLGAQIDDVHEGGKTVGVGGGAGRGSRGDGEHARRHRHGPKINGPAGTESAGGGKGPRRRPTGRIKVGEQAGVRRLDADARTSCSRKIQSAYMAGLKRCYKEYLKKDASARGKVTLSLTVNETGRTVKGNAKGFADEVDDCIPGLMVELALPDPEGQGRRADRRQLRDHAPARSGLREREPAPRSRRDRLADRSLGRRQVHARDGARGAARSAAPPRGARRRRGPHVPVAGPRLLARGPRHQRAAHRLRRAAAREARRARARRGDLAVRGHAR